MKKVVLLFTIIVSSILFLGCEESGFEPGPMGDAFEARLDSVLYSHNDDVYCYYDDQYYHRKISFTAKNGRDDIWFMEIKIPHQTNGTGVYSLANEKLVSLYWDRKPYGSSSNHFFDNGDCIVEVTRYNSQGLIQGTVRGELINSNGVRRKLTDGIFFCSEFRESK